MRIAIKTLGCKANRYESDKIFDALRGMAEVFELNEGVSSFNPAADLLIVNTCTVTHIADRKSRQAIRSFKRANPECKVVAFGCGVNVSREDYDIMNEVDFLAENSDEVVELSKNIIQEKGEEFESCEYEGIESDFDAGVRTRALVKIQDGCNRYCTYCIIPTARGPEYSFPSKQILKEVLEKEALGFREIVLTGIIASEWNEDGKDIADLIEMLIEGTSDVRFRLSSLEPKNFSAKFFKLFESCRLCPHIPMSLQSGSDSVLYRMKRNYDTKFYFDVCEKFRNVVPDIGLTTDVIVGFPGESDKEFKETCNFVRKTGFLKMHVFPYSKRKGTAAYLMKGHLNNDIKKERSSVLRTISDELGRAFMLGCVGKEYRVIVETIENNVCSGFTGNYIPVQFSCSESDENLLNKRVSVRLLSVQNNGNVAAELL